jgi:transmembrane sensor
LEGEGFFEVKKGSSFSVLTPQGQVSVLGTSFNVFARNEHFDVRCVTGKVAVDHADAHVVLMPGQAASLQSGDQFVTNEFNTVGDSWQQGTSRFEEASLNDVLDELGRQYNVQIIHTDLNHRKYTGAFRHNNLKEALDAVCLPMGLHYSMGADMEVRITE